ncbi:hypothetical protein FB45DRAFT_911848 [Roridomyces roridus]|uniref:BZIP domain-containing protein n=1 Tax=Roridomyces roridus TaxID=1738132 RepID=A0AAD7FMC8_9AGAR|nr:hypothetical protein FB45DRAFT_911848 [Roridomyces roridus]
MPPSSALQGLNLVHPPLPPSNSNQDLLSGPAFPDLLIPIPDTKRLNRDADDDDADHQASEPMLHHGHVNMVTGINVPDGAQGYDLGQFLANFNLPPSTSAISPSIVQLLALHSAVQGNGPPAPFPQMTPAPEQSPTLSSSTDYPPAKRARTRKSSISASLADSPEDVAAPTLNVAEDKRRRNTAASARFRLKKKEREAALETKAKELEGRVNELERECEGLRRENGWLKGLVVGVTGVAQAPPQQTSSSSLKRSREE